MGYLLCGGLGSEAFKMVSATVRQIWRDGVAGCGPESPQPARKANPRQLALRGELWGAGRGPSPGSLGALAQHWSYPSRRVIFKHFPTEGF